MISVYKLKPKFQQLLHPLLVWLHQKKVTANLITVVAIVFSFCIGVLFWEASAVPFFFLALPIGLLIRMILNALDGMMAREFGQTSRLGELLNELGDVISDVFIFFPLLKYHPESLYLIVVFIVLSVLNEFAGILLWSRDNSLFSGDFLHHHCAVAPEYFYPLKKRTLCQCPIVNMPMYHCVSAAGGS